MLQKNFRIINKIRSHWGSRYCRRRIKDTTVHPPSQFNEVESGIHYYIEYLWTIHQRFSIRAKRHTTR